MRYQGKTSRPYYNIDQEYIEAMLHGYFVGYKDENEENEEYEDIYDLISESDDDTIEPIEPGDCEYGGYWYKKAIESQSPLIAFYEKFGFEESKKQRKYFGSTPYPCYRKHLTHSSL